MLRKTRLPKAVAIYRVRRRRAFCLNALAQILAKRIRLAGPLSVADYMAECLLHPEHGYYTTQTPFGTKGDFTTAPEISQMFGELLGLCLAQTWLDQGAPAPFTLAELGPGRGTLMADVLRATHGVPGFHAALHLHLVEASPNLRAQQKAAIDARVTHHTHVGDLPRDQPLYLLANEFFDALPIRQFLRDGEAWRERLVGLTEETLAFGLSDPTNPESLTHRLTDTKTGDMVELCPSATPIAEHIGDHIARQGGCAIFIDYGDWRSRGDTLQAVKNHDSVPALTAPGECDLTAHVDFEALAIAALPAKASAMISQGVLLDRLGITQRAEILARNLTGDALNSHVKAHRRLTHPEEMGTLFKAMALVPEGSSLPPGFDPQ